MARNRNDNFTQKIIKVLKERAGHKCSNPIVNAQRVVLRLGAVLGGGRALVTDFKLNSTHIPRKNSNHNSFQPSTY